MSKLKSPCCKATLPMRSTVKDMDGISLILLTDECNSWRKPSGREFA